MAVGAQALLACLPLILDGLPGRPTFFSSYRAARSGPSSSQIGLGKDIWGFPEVIPDANFAVHRGTRELSGDWGHYPFVCANCSRIASMAGSRPSL